MERPSPRSLIVVVGCLGLSGLGCAARRPLPPRRDATYEVATVAGIGPRRMSEHFAFTTAPLGPQTWEVRTLWTDSTWEDPAGVIAFDSRNPERGDPWPLVTQHAVSSVPAAVHFDGGGRPDRLVDAAHWEVLALAALDGLDLPEAGRASGAPLVDPDGFLRDLARTFPGRPAEVWIRPFRAVGVDLQRVERCVRERADGVVTWRCSGSLTAPEDAPVRLHDTATTSRLVVDRRGLRSFEERASGTVFLQRRGGVADEPFAILHLVERR